MRNCEKNDKGQERKAGKKGSQWVQWMWTCNSWLPGYGTSSLERRVVTSTVKFICRLNIVAKCHHVFGSRKNPVWPDIVQRKSKKSIRQDPCGIALQFSNGLASWWNYSITYWGRNCAIRVCRLFEDISSHKSEILAPTNTTERSKGIFSDNHAKKLIDLFQDMIQHVKERLFLSLQFWSDWQTKNWIRRFLMIIR